jgi:putative transposase
VDQALFAVVMEAYVHGVSTRKVDDLVQALGVASGVSKSEVSRICADLDGELAVFRDRSLAGQDYPHVFLDATYCKAPRWQSEPSGRLPGGRGRGRGDRHRPA